MSAREGIQQSCGGDSCGGMVTKLRVSIQEVSHDILELHHVRRLWNAKGPPRDRLYLSGIGDARYKSSAVENSQDLSDVSIL